MKEKYYTVIKQSHPSKSICAFFVGTKEDIQKRTELNDESIDDLLTFGKAYNRSVYYYATELPNLGE